MTYARTLAAPLIALLLAGCGLLGTSNVPVTANTEAQRSCEAAANDDPVVKRIMIVGLGNPHKMHEDQARLAEARQDATVACLQRMGVVRQGGVERQKPL